MTELSIIIPTHGRDASLKTLLNSLEQQSLDARRFEVIVAIDGQMTGTKALLRDLEPPYALRWLAGPRLGPGVARNRGAAVATGQLLLFLDDDMLADPGLLQAHIQAHRSGENIICLGQVRLLPHHRLSPWERYLNHHFELHYDKMGRPGYSPTFWDCLSGNLSLSRHLFLESRGFDPIFGEGKHEDIELGYRLNGMGVCFHYQSGALSYHRFAKNLAQGLHDGLLNGSSTLHFVRYCPELFPQLLLARWQRYPAPFRRLLKANLPRSVRRHRLVSQSAAALGRIEGSRLPARLRRPLYRLAYHLHFWQGLAQVAEPDELCALLLKLGR